MLNRRRAVVLLGCGLLACAAAAVYRMQWHPSVLGRWIGAYGPPGVKTPPPDSPDYNMPFLFSKDGTYVDNSALASGTWKEVSGGIALQPLHFDGSTKEEVFRKWSKKKSPLPKHQETFLNSVFLPRTLEFDGHYLHERGVDGSADAWFRKD